MLMLVPVSVAEASYHSCRSANSTTLYRHERVRVFAKKVSTSGGALREQVYGCSTAFGRKVHLGPTEFGERDSFSRYTSAGRFLLYRWDDLCGACSDYGSRVVVVDLKNSHSSKELMPRYATAAVDPQCEVYPHKCIRRYEKLVLNRTGSFAMSYEAQPVDYDTGLPPGVKHFIIERHVLGRGLRSEKVKILDRVSGRRDLRSLRLDGATLYWSNAGKQKHASIHP